MKDTHHKFSHITISLHWIIAIAIISMIGFGLYIEELPRSPEKGEFIGLHKSFGVLILILASIRIVWRIQNKFPKPISQLPNWQTLLAKLTHWALIIGTALMPISGIIMSVGGDHPVAVFGIVLIEKSGQEIEWLSQFGHTLHGWGGKLLIVFILLHIAGALKHQVLDGDGTLSRMLGKKIG